MFRELHQRGKLAIKPIINVLYSVFGMFVLHSSNLHGHTMLRLFCQKGIARRNTRFFSNSTFGNVERTMCGVFGSPRSIPAIQLLSNSYMQIRTVSSIHKKYMKIE